MSDYEIVLLLRAAATFMAILSRGDGPSENESDEARNIAAELIRAAHRRDVGGE